MTDHRLQEQREHELTMQVFAVSAAMVGVCLTAIGILQVVQAQKQHAAVLGLRSELQLVQAAVVLVRPSPVPGLALTLTPSEDGTSGTLLVEGGEPGVFYRFLRDDETSELGLPAYVQKLDDSTIASGLNLNKGVGQVRIATDLVVARLRP